MPHQLLLKYLSSKTNFVFNQTLYTLFREICRNDTFERLLQTLLKELFTNKGEILSCKSVKPCKNRKNSRACYVRTRDKSGSNSPVQTQEVGRSTRLRLVFTLHFFRALVTSLRALSQNKARFWLFYLLSKIIAAPGPAEM